MGVKATLRVFLSFDEAKRFRDGWDMDEVDTAQEVFNDMIGCQVDVFLDPDRIESVVDTGVTLTVKVRDEGVRMLTNIHLIRITMMSGDVFFDFTNERLEEYLHEWELV